MPSIYNLKPAFQNLLRPCSDWLARRHVTPNAVTILAIILSLLTGITIYLYPTKRWFFLCIPMVLLLRMILNAIDGMLAREHHMQTALGIFLNELGDIVSDACLYLPFSLVPGISSNLIVLIVLLAIISETTGIIAIQVSSARRYDGPMGKSDRAFAFGTIGLLLGLGLAANIWLNMILGILVILLIATIVNRIIHALKEA